MQAKEFVIITGLSGAGKSRASKVFEDIGFFCVDNLPAPLIPKFAELCYQTTNAIDRIALVIDIRGDMFLESLNSSLAQLKEMDIRYQIIFLEAGEDVLVRRFKENRRHHPLSPQGSILEGIKEEKEKLRELRGMANKIIDTSRFSDKELREDILSQWNHGEHQMTITILSFGYKHGIPMDTDLMMDVRFLANPHYIPELKNLTGRNEEVQAYVYATASYQYFIKQYSELLLHLLPEYIAEGKTNLSIGIGCTGGQHRSVAVSIALGALLSAAGYHVIVNHRDS